MKKRNETVEHIIALLYILALFICLFMVGVLFYKQVGFQFMQVVVTMILVTPVVIILIVAISIIKRIFK